MRRRAALVIDDSPEVRELVALLLGDEGFEVRQARDGLEAFELLAESETPDVIVLDLLMPLVDGWRFLSLCREFEAFSRIPVVALSSFPGPRGMTPPVDAIVHKPFRHAELTGAVGAVLAARAGL